MDFRARDPVFAGLFILEITEEFLSAEEYIIMFWLDLLDLPKPEGGLLDVPDDPYGLELSDTLL